MDDDEVDLDWLLVELRRVDHAVRRIKRAVAQLRDQQNTSQPDRAQTGEPDEIRHRRTG